MKLVRQLSLQGFVFIFVILSTIMMGLLLTGCFATVLNDSNPANWATQMDGNGEPGDPYVTTNEITAPDTSSDDGPAAQWVKHIENPIISVSPSYRGEKSIRYFDQQSLGQPCVLKIGDKYHMWYSASDGTSNDGSVEDDPLKDPAHANDMSDQLTKYIGYAYSYDGVNWTKYYDSGSNPPSEKNDTPASAILSPTPDSYDEGGLVCPMVIYDKGRYRMWYTGIYYAPYDDPESTCTYGDPKCPNYRNKDYPWVSLVQNIFIMMYAESQDGIHWTKWGPVADFKPTIGTGTYDGLAVSQINPQTWGPWVVKEEETGYYWMFYTLSTIDVRTLIIYRIQDENNPTQNKLVYMYPEVKSIPYDTDFYNKSTSWIGNFSDAYTSNTLGNVHVKLSKNGYNWFEPKDFPQKSYDIENPVFTGPGSDQNDEWDSFFNLLIRDGGSFYGFNRVSIARDNSAKNPLYYMLYSSGGVNSSIGYVYSRDNLYSWEPISTDAEERKILQHGVYLTWESGGVRYPSALIVGDTMRVWYNGVKFPFGESPLPYATEMDVANFGLAEVNLAGLEGAE